MQMKNGTISKIIFIIWVGNCLFWIQLFNSKLLSNLTNSPQSTVDSLNDIVNSDNKYIVLIEKSSFVYNKYFKVSETKKIQKILFN